jgi:hypothetical protein
MMGRNAAEASRRSRPWRPRGRAVRYSVPEQQEPPTSGYEPVWSAYPLQSFPASDSQPEGELDHDIYI